ncbi:hypothetical protein IQ264_07055 [Phormidium sp. LEGE 05292]|uniref:HD domain-containing protein n=1 Tax=[Phormidium] sp. LEGE 05292 TaxID=767427 RepID=UPI00187F6B34|nr:hypothetical protein [Phormidium sp. LEGE 05292]MBE9225190.1 hypothetical protein [Phormidium sp. LEGE 05292]
MQEIALSKWQSLLVQFAVDSTISKQIFFELIFAYSSPYRYYHNLVHIQQVLEIIEKMRSHSQNFPALQFATWFHDIIYDPKAKDNEEKSAAKATKVLTNLGIPSSTVATICQLILTTKSHQISADSDIDSQIFLDADLSILGASQAEYQVYAKSIRKEYAWLSEPEYRTGRLQVLDKFCQRKRIYYTQQMFDALELQARQNMQEEIKFLTAINDIKI